MDQATPAATVTWTQSHTTLPHPSPHSVPVKGTQLKGHREQQGKWNARNLDTPVDSNKMRGSAITTTQQAKNPALNVHKRGPIEEAMVHGGGASEVSDGQSLPQKPRGDEVVTGALRENAPCKSVYEVLMHEGLYEFLDILKVLTLCIL
jgi:hypothetical protein